MDSSLCPGGHCGPGCIKITTPGAKDAGCPIHERGKVPIGGLIETCDGAKLRVYLVADRQRSIDLLGKTRARVRGTYESPSLILEVGKIQWIGATGQIETDEIIVDSINTVFTVARDLNGHNEVFAGQGRVHVRRKSNGQLFELDTGQAFVIGPKVPDGIVEGRNVEAELEAFEFVGDGHLQSQVIDNQLLLGKLLLPPERAPLPLPGWQEDPPTWPPQPIFLDVFFEF